MGCSTVEITPAFICPERTIRIIEYELGKMGFKKERAEFWIHRNLVQIKKNREKKKLREERTEDTLSNLFKYPGVERVFKKQIG
jgi:hypothetical protein